MLAISWENVFDHAKDFLFKNLEAKYVLSLNFSAEESQFVRLTQSKIRQISQVEQSNLDVELYFEQKRASISLNLSQNQSLNEKELSLVLEKLHTEIQSLPDDPYLVPVVNNGESKTICEGEKIEIEKILNFINEKISHVDLAGILVVGSNHRANANSLGQKHWFSSTSFYLDYSLYSAKQKAVKGFYGGANLNLKDLDDNLSESLQSLKVMDLKPIVLSPGKYRAYLAPAAVSELLNMLRWDALSGSAYKRGESAFTDLVDQRKKLSPKFNLTEDFSLGLFPRFNEKGEMFDQQMKIIEKGILKNLFISLNTQKEFGLESNKSSEEECHRSAVIETGKLKRENILKELDTGLYLSNLHYLNYSDKPKGRITGMTRFGCLWVENGEVVGPIKDLRFDETLYHLFGEGLMELTDFSEISLETSTYERRSIGGSKVPGLLVDKMSFTL